MKVKNIIKQVLKGLLATFIVLEVVLMCFIMISKVTGNSPSLFGYQFYVIITPSMEPELHVGDVILSKKYNGEQIKEEQVITYLGKEGSYRGKVVTHEVVKVEEINGETQITTKGLKNNLEDPSITKEDVLGIMLHKTVVFGLVYRVISSTPGFILLILLPLLVLISSEIYRLAKILHGDEDEEEDQQKGEANDKS